MASMNPDHPAALLAMIRGRGSSTSKAYLQEMQRYVVCGRCTNDRVQGGRGGKDERKM